MNRETGRQLYQFISLSYSNNKTNSPISPWSNLQPIWQLSFCSSHPKMDALSSLALIANGDCIHCIKQRNNFYQVLENPFHYSKIYASPRKGINYILFQLLHYSSASSQLYLDPDCSPPSGYWHALAHSQLLGVTQNKEKGLNSTRVWETTKSLD